MLVAVMLVAVMLVSSFSASCLAVDGELPRMGSALVTIIDSVEVAAAQGGIVVEVPVRAGDFVKQGATLVRTDDRDDQIKTSLAKLALEQAERDAANDVALRIARNKHEVAVKELQRAELLNSRLPTSVTEAEIVILKLTRDQTKLEIEQAEKSLASLRLTTDMRRKELEQAQIKQELHQVRSPQAGMVARVDHRTGEWVDTGKTVVRLVRVDRLRAEGFLPISIASTSLIGRAAELTVKMKGSAPVTVKGEVVFVNPEANAVNGEVQVWAEFPNADLALRPGLRGTVTILEERVRRVNKVASSTSGG